MIRWTTSPDCPRRAAPEQDPIIDNAQRPDWSAPADTPFSAEVVEVHRLRWNTTVVRLISSEPVPFYAGQAVRVRTPHFPNETRYYYCALPPSIDGRLEFHVRTVPGGLTSEAVVNAVRPGEVWQIGAGEGALRIDSSGRPAVLAAFGIGLAPMRALLFDLAQNGGAPETFLFYADTYRRDLYALDALQPLTDNFEWLTVVALADRPGEPPLPDPFHQRLQMALRDDPAAAAVIDPTTAGVVDGSIEDILASYGGFRNEQVLVAGPRHRVGSIIGALTDAGTPIRTIRT